SFTRTRKTAALNIDGPVWQLPSGPIQFAVGVERRDDNLTNQVDKLATGTAEKSFTTCLLAQETCSNVTAGSVNVYEEYFEALVPLVTDMPMVKALNLDFGTRWSH